MRSPRQGTTDTPAHLTLSTVLKAIGTLCLTTLLAWVLGKISFLDPIERHAAQQLTIWMPPGASSTVRVVRITDDDYGQLFKSQSPLNPGPLQEVVNLLSDAKPCAIGLDIDTSDDRFRQLALVEPSMVVWARGAAWNGQALVPAPMVNRPDQANNGVALFSPDPDGVLRKYRRQWKTSEGAVRSFSCAVLQTAIDRCGATTLGLQKRAGDVCPASDANEDRYIMYAPERLEKPELTYTASEIQKSRSEDRKQFAGKIVLLGGSYAASGDRDRPTPIGPLPGVEIIAQVIETELGGGGYKPVGRGMLALLFLFDAYLVMLLFDTIGFMRTVGAVLIAIPVFAVVLGVFTGAPPAYLGLILFFLLTLNVTGWIIQRGKVSVLPVAHAVIAAVPDLLARKPRDPRARR